MKRIKVIEGAAYIERLSALGMKRKIWEKLLRNWIKLMDKYLVAARGRGDLPYWNGEDANTSFLAAAAWKLGGVAIEQFYAERKKGKSKGHSDLWIRFNGQKDFDFVAEAKRYDETIKLEKIKEKILNKLAEAEQNLKDLDERYKSKHLISICFVFPRINKKKRGKFSEEEFIKKVIEAFEKEKNIIVASYFPKIDMKKYRSPEYGDKFEYPGVLLVARIEK